VSRVEIVDVTPTPTSRFGDKKGRDAAIELSGDANTEKRLRAALTPGGESLALRALLHATTPAGEFAEESLVRDAGSPMRSARNMPTKFKAK
jgi:hypothetical protein